MSKKLYCVAIKEGNRYVYEEYYRSKAQAKTYAETHRHAFLREGYYDKNDYYFHTVHCSEWKNDTWVSNY